jgi:hypothetical protein
MCADAAVGSKAVLGRGIEKSLGVPQGALHFLNFISAEFSRDTKENPSDSITGSGGHDRGTPGAIAFAGKLKYDLTVDRVLMDLVGQHGAPSSIVPVPGAVSVAVTTPGTGYTTAPTVTPSGGGGGATLPRFHAVVAGGAVTAVIIDDAGSDLTATVTLAFGGPGTGAAATVTLGTIAWIVKIRPGAGAPTPRSLWTYLDEGGAYTGSVQYARRPSDISIAEAANKRLVCDVTYADPTGDSISGFAVAKTANAGTVGDVKSIASRGRRPYDSNYTGGLSLYLKVVSSTANTVTLKAAFAAASPGTGSGFPTPTYGAFTFVAYRPGQPQALNGYVTVIDSTTGLPIGLFGENNDPYEITFGDQSTAALVANDEFEIPWQLPAGGVSKTVFPENRLSAFHLVRKIGGTDTRFDSGTTKWMRTFTPYYTNARRLPDSVDPTGYITATVTFKKRLFDRAFRTIQEVAQRFVIEDVYRFNTPIGGLVYEGIHAFYPQAAVTTMKSGDVPNRERLEESITLEVEQPDSLPSAPAPLLAPAATFDASIQYPFQICLVTRNDPTFLA